MPERGQQKEGSNPFADLSARLRFRAAAACVLDVAPIHIGEAPSSASAAATACSRATGNDYIEARDGLVDVVGWGPGRDEVNADRRDLVGADGKVVRR